MDPGTLQGPTPSRHVQNPRNCTPRVLGSAKPASTPTRHHGGTGLEEVFMRFSAKLQLSLFPPPPSLGPTCTSQECRHQPPAPEQGTPSKPVVPATRGMDMFRFQSDQPPVRQRDSTSEYTPRGASAQRRGTAPARTSALQPPASGRRGYFTHPYRMVQGEGCDQRI